MIAFHLDATGGAGLSNEAYQKTLKDDRVQRQVWVSCTSTRQKSWEII